MKQPLQFTGRAFLNDEGKPDFRLEVKPADLRGMVLERFGEGQFQAAFGHFDKCRSKAQNAYYWGVVVHALHAELQRLGNEVSSEQVHELLRDKFLSQPLAAVGAEQIGTFRKSTAVMSRTEFMEYLDEVTAWAADKLSLNIPAPKPGQMPEDVWETVALDCGLTVRPDTPGEEARYFLSIYQWRTASCLNDARYQVIHSGMGSEAKRLALEMIKAKADEMSCHFNAGSSTYIPVVRRDSAASNLELQTSNFKLQTSNSFA